MRTICGAIIAAATAIVLSGTNGFAAGTAAGTDITNQASAVYSVGTNSFTAQSAFNTIKVAELIGLTLTWQDAAPGVTATSGQTGRVTTYRLTNTGNGSETFKLSKTDAGLGGDNFDPLVTALYLDTNNNGAYDAGTDTLYTAGANDPTLAADGGITLFALASIPTTSLNDGDKGSIELIATAGTGTITPATGVAPGTVFSGAGTGGGDAVVGSSRGTQTATGVYVVSGVAVAVNKSAVVLDQFGGSEPIPGATIRYAITVSVTGAGTAAGVVVTDPLPANTTYTAGTLKLDGAPLTDPADGDAGDVGGTTAGTVRVRAGDLTSGSGSRTITFDVKIN